MKLLRDKIFTFETSYQLGLSRYIPEYRENRLYLGFLPNLLSLSVTQKMVEYQMYFQIHISGTI